MGKESQTNLVEINELFNIYIMQSHIMNCETNNFHDNEHDNSASHPNYHNNSHDNTPGQMQLKLIKNETNKYFN